MKRRTRFTTTLLLAACLCLPGLLAAQTKSPEIEALERFFTAETIEADWFAQVFLDQVPASQLMPVRQQVTTGLGAFQRAEPDPSGQGYRAIFEKGHIPSTISLDGEGKINGLFLRPPVMEVSSTQEAIDNLTALGGEVAVLVTRNGEPLHAVNADVPLAVGSAFKLSILAALAQAVEEGDLRWEDVHVLGEGDRSLPSGTLQSWPEGAPITLYSLAARMISESDNTATDALLHALGRDRVEAAAPARNRPFLSTREAFVLKNPEHADLADAYEAGGEDTRRQILEKAVGLSLPGASVFTGEKTVRPGIEWFYSARELCAVMEAVAANPVTRINDGGIASAADWASVSYKGGSEPGVLNQTFWLHDQAGNDFCVAATRNADQPFDNTPLFSAMNGLIAALHRGSPATP